MGRGIEKGRKRTGEAKSSRGKTLKTAFFNQIFNFGTPVPTLVDRSGPDSAH